jgi:hypothetical protein
MSLSATLCAMDTRQIAGSIVRDELARQGWRSEKAAEAMHVARSTLYRVMDGAPTVQPVTLRAVEGLLDFPRRFLDLVIAGDVAHIRDLPGLDEDLRRHTLEALADSPPPERSQRRHG